jgi:DNA-binding NtrC family response regulator
VKGFPILVVDDERVARESLAAWVREDGFVVDTAESGAEAARMSAEREYALYFVDLKMPPGMDGIETMAEIRRHRPGAVIIIITAHGAVDTAIQAMKAGAQEYLLKPCNPEEISLLVQRHVRVRRLERENAVLRRKLARQHRIEDIVSRSPRMLEIFSLVREVADQRSTVLIEGESGTGKEMIARALHSAGSRSSRPFVGISCAALTESLLESELFGHEKGAFTGAVARKKGKFELADGGTLLLDEADDIPPKLQGELLRVLQERRFFRVGGVEEVPVDVRVVAATKVDMLEMVREGRFRSDLYYRLNVIRIHLPPLRERREDIPLLVRHFVDRLGVELKRDITDVTDGALAVLMDHDWPGNVRELENAVERAMATCGASALRAQDFDFLAAGARARTAESVPADLPLREVEKRVIEATMRRHGGNVTEAAQALGIDRSSLYDRLKRHGIAR